MDIKDKIIKGLFQALKPEYVRLEDDDGISGFVVSRQFEGMSTLDRQGLIEKVLSKGPQPLTQGERRRVLIIAGLTPIEYESVGARIMVHSVREMTAGAVEVLLRGSLSDAEYVRGALKNQKGVRTTEPKPANGALGLSMSFRAKGTEATPLTKEKTIRILRKDPYIEVTPNA
jgi:hypothetical protein